MLQAFGGVIPTETPKEIVVEAGIRGGKSLWGGACATTMAMRVDMRLLGPGEIPRVSILSLSVDIAKATWNHVCGRIQASPVLRELLLDEPTTESLLLRHPSGRPVEIKVAAGARAAGSLVARWSAGAIFDEAPRMVGAEEGVVNLDDARNAVVGRLLPGAQMLALGSPWAPFGPVYKLDQMHFGRPSRAIVFVKATGPMLNPVWWNPERCRETEEKDPDGYRVNVMCQYISPEAALFSLTLLERCSRTAPGDIAPQARYHYVAAMDPGTRGNAWTLAVVTHDGEKQRVVCARQWIGSQTAPLSPRAVLAEVAALLREYRCTAVATDQFAADFLRELLPDGLSLVEVPWTSRNKTEAFESLRVKMAENKVELPQDPQVQKDLLGVRKVVTQNAIAISLPLTSDGRHCDYAPAVALACSINCWPPDPEPLQGAAAEQAERRAERDRAIAEVRARLRAQDRSYRF